MSLHRRALPPVPEATAQVARRAFRRGNPYLRLRDTLGAIFDDADFDPLYGHAGHPALSPAQLALVTLMQYAEDLTDQQAAEAARSRLDWKYALGLALDDAGFDASVLSEFRTRLVAAGRETMLFERVVERLKEQDLIRAQGRQRTDSTHVLGAISRLNRLELVGEAMRAALNALADLAPDWLRQHSDPAWVERYGPRLVARRLPRKEAERDALMRQIGADGWLLIDAAGHPETPAVVRDCPALATLGTIWAQQYIRDEDGPRPRPTEELPPAGVLRTSPYDDDARTGEKRDTVWAGYKVHLTETCDDGLPRLITQVETTPAPIPDSAMALPIQQDLAARALAPMRHLMDAGYTTGAGRVAGQVRYGITTIGPVRPNSSWQARSDAGYSAAAFVIDWERQLATCPQGKQSSTWREVPGRSGEPAIQLHFRLADCMPCPARALCTRADRRSLTVPLHATYEAQRQARELQESDAGRHEYRRRAGIEGTLSRAVRRCDLRHARYRGLAKTHLQHCMTAAAINLVRTAEWLAGTAPPSTRQPAFVRALAQ